MKKNNTILLLIILFIYITIPMCIFFSKDLFNAKFYILTIVGILIFCIMKLFKIPNNYITKDNLIISVKRNSLLIIIFTFAIIGAKLFSFDKYIPNETIIFYIFYIFISCSIQEFLCRGVFGYFEKIMNFKWLWIIVSSLFYSFVHIIYKDHLTCIFTFILGIILYQLYRIDYNLCGVVLSHNFRDTNYIIGNS